MTNTFIHKIKLKIAPNTINFNKIHSSKKAFHVFKDFAALLDIFYPLFSVFNLLLNWVHQGLTNSPLNSRFWLSLFILSTPLCYYYHFDLSLHFDPRYAQRAATGLNLVLLVKTQRTILDLGLLKCIKPISCKLYAFACLNGEKLGLNHIIFIIPP